MENNQSGLPSTENNQDTIFNADEFSMQGYDKHIRQARTAIFLAAGILLLNVIILTFSVPDSYEYLWLDYSIWGGFIAGFVFLGFWSKKKPYYAIVGAIVLYAALVILNAIIDPSSIWKGIILKIIIIVLLVKGLNDARDAQRMQAQFGKKD